MYAAEQGRIAYTVPAMSEFVKRQQASLTRDELMAVPKADAKMRADLAALGSLETDTVGPLD